jgi:hypothetical protein
MRIARWVWVSLAIAGCGSAGAPPSYPPLGPEPTPAPPSPSLADELVPLPASDPAYDPKLGTPPPSKPQGPPVTLTLRAPQIGDVRTRALQMRNVIDNDRGDKKFRQLSSNRYEFREELWKIEGDALVFKVHVNHATEAVMLKDKPHSVTTASGDYIVAAEAGQPAKVGREDNSELGGREIEELADVFGFDHARPHPLAQIASKRALRVGESVEMTEAESTLFGGGRKVTAPVHLTLLEATARTARYQADVMLTFEADHARRLRYWVTIDRATGRLVELHELMHDLETGEGSRQEQVQHLVMTLGYP